MKVRMEIASEKFNNKFSLKTIVLVLIISGIALSFEYPKIDSNEPCVSDENGRNSTCVLLSDCDVAKTNIKINKRPQTCGFVGIEPKVCCPGYQETRQNLQYRVRTGHLAVKACNDFYGVSLELDPFFCDYCTTISEGVLVTDITEFKHMVRSFTSHQISGKYSLKILRPGNRKIYFSSVSKEYFPKTVDPFLLNYSLLKALVGVDVNGHQNWICGGSLISESYVLTAAHCTYSKQFGYVNYVRLGELDYTTDSDKTEHQDFTISKIINHPNYTAPSRYHDIALLKLNQSVKITNFVQPACLHTQPNTNLYSDTGVLVIAGWGATQFSGDGSSQLRKAEVEIMLHEYCSQYHSNDSRYLKHGLLEELQICAGSSTDGRNTCQGDSGGPLQLVAPVKDEKVTFIVGVTSFGQPCGITEGVPGIYTRVFSYLEWIEDVVWKKTK